MLCFVFHLVLSNECGFLPHVNENKPSVSTDIYGNWYIGIRHLIYSYGLFVTFPGDGLNFKLEILFCLALLKTHNGFVYLSRCHNQFIIHAVVPAK